MIRSKNSAQYLKVLALGLMLAVFSISVYPQQATAAESTGQAVENSSSAAAMAFDGLLVRPLSMAATVVGAAAFVVTLPFSALGGNVGEAAHTMVAKPFAFTFSRPLGEYPKSLD